MPYFPPYIDAAGIHLPTYEDRLEDLVSAYRNIFGAEAELSPAVPDYQLLSVFARALDDVSALVLQDYNSRNPMYAAGNALDLLLPQYGITREEGETDAEVRARMNQALLSRGAFSLDAMEAALRSIPNVADVLIRVNETDAAADSIPAHTIAALVLNGSASRIAEVIYAKKPPGIGTWGSTTVNAADREGNLHPVSFTRHTDKIVFLYFFIRVLDGGDPEAIRNAVVPAAVDYADRLGLAVPLNVPQLYGAAYAADPAIADTFIITDIQAAEIGAPAMERETVACAWNEKISVPLDRGVSITFT